MTKGLFVDRLQQTRAENAMHFDCCANDLFRQFIAHFSVPSVISVATLKPVLDSFTHPVRMTLNQRRKLQSAANTDTSMQACFATETT
ncbi:hypothetical protein Poly41_28280 [Novipirellula artificiosorum]|uniref:Uncharacterized protein n=1 Tax=Novipirellula artificiosorum TaxID=2528016 RepID=A0A5C6DP20_9BACT|nr:hypothetical protein Poly41_28280 [Novipirellula artificiosorum]